MKSKFEEIYEIVRLIPSGKVSTYGAIAQYFGSKRGARLVGWAMNNSHFDSTIPAHRVVNRNGVLSGRMHFSDPNQMQKSLESEGIKVKDDKIVDFDLFFWDPNKELL